MENDIITVQIRRFVIIICCINSK